MRRGLCLALCLVPLPAFAQESDRSYLTALLEDNLSGAGRQVVITGFEGALSSQARLSQMTIADDAGIWLTLSDVTLDWNRAALLSGRVEVQSLTAAEITLSRLPQTETGSIRPEATEFTLPELPVSIEIGRVAADRIVIGPSVLGQPVEGRFDAALSLINGEGSADLVLERSDSGPAGQIALTASYSNTEQRLSLDLTAEEQANGLVASALDLPGRPAVKLMVKGNGPFDAFGADVALSTDGSDRLLGRIETESLSDATSFSADLSGDVAPLFLPDYAEFFGNQVALKAKGLAHADGRLDLDQLHLKARALDLTGSLALGADRAPRAFSLTGQIAQADGAAVLLPLTTDLPVRVQTADIALSYDATQDEGWTGSATIQGFDRPDFRASRLGLAGSGRIAPGLFGATLRFDAEGLEPTQAALGTALGSFVSGDGVFFWTDAEKALSIPRLSLVGQDYSAQITGAQLDGLAEGLAITGKAEGQFDDLSRLGPLAQLPLSGMTKTTVSGRIVPLSGAFDLAITAEGQDMQMGQPNIDALLRGAANIDAAVIRDQNGTRVTSATLAANKVTGTVQGLLSSDNSDLTAKLQFTDLSALEPGLGGRIDADARLTGPFNDASVIATATGQQLRIGNPEIDKILAGTSRLAADLALRDGALQINRATLANGEVTAEVTGLAAGGEQRLDVKAQLRNLGLILPDFAGPLGLTGKVVNRSDGAMLDLVAKGPGGIDAVITGLLAPASSGNDLAIRGRAQAALANVFLTPRSVSGGLGFDLRLQGDLSPAALSGQVSLENGRFSDPGFAFGLTGITARADLSGGQANVKATLPLTTAGKAVVAGTIGLAEPFSAALGIALEGITLRDPALYESRLRGALTLTGPLAGTPLLAGDITLIETELQVPSTGFGGAGGLPDLSHVNEPTDVRATRIRAGLLEQAVTAARASANGDIALDLTIIAPNRLFLRGRGLDAELGGELRLLGNLSNLQPAGSFNLIRGRLDILGKRLDLTEATLQLEGDLVPYLTIEASTDNDGITAFMLIEGRADDPKVSFTSFPDLPEEEVLAQLLFGQNLQNLSALQALQLANAVATLAGRGGDGVISRLRRNFGLDNLDLKTTAEGGAEVAVGKYISKNAYTEITVDQNGKSQINLNLDLSGSVTLKGKAASDGDTGIGIFVEKDY